LLLSCFSSPGYSSERFFIYYAEVKDADKVAQGGGLKNEHESIEVVELDIATFKKKLVTGKIRDAKTCIAGFYFFLHRRK